MKRFKFWLWCWAPHRGWLHRCECCHARNRSVSDWSFKINPGRWFCGECGWGQCNFDCNGVPWRRQARNQ